MPETTWPAGVIARYLTVGGATVDLRRVGEFADYRYDCQACGDTWTFPKEDTIRHHAQRHAEECRAMPRPTA